MGPILSFCNDWRDIDYVYRILLYFKRSSPLYDANFHIPVVKHIDKKLIIGSVLFGIGWGLGGLCPGPAVAILGYSFFPAIIFMIAMLIGLFIGKRFINF